MELYIHIPFCKKKCLYCDFLSWDDRQEAVAGYVRALLQDIRHSLAPCTENLASIYIGGGTPGVLDAEYIEAILCTVKDSCKVAESAEITIELNPCTVTEEKAKRYFSAGINRVSMGVQSLHNEELKLLGRIHSEGDVYNAYEILRKAGFDNISMDLIQGLPGQTADSFLTSLEKIIRLSPEHISAYELIVEPGTPFYELYGPESGYEFDEEVQADIYTETVRRLEQAGYSQYEISNYAKKGRESVHNCGYWTGESYIGCGAGAVGYVGNRRVTKRKDLGGYIANPFEVTAEIIDRNEKKQEFVFLGMRMKQGIAVKKYEERFGEPFPEAYDKIFRKYMPEYVLTENGRYFFTTKGFLISNIILSEFI